MRRDPAALAAAAVLGLILLGCVLAPLYASRVARIDPFRSNVDGEVLVGGVPRPVLAENTAGLGLGVTPIGPTWRAAFFLGADGQGRDLAARLLYGGRVSLLVSAGATLLCIALAGLAGTAAGYLGGVADAVIARGLDLLWAFPVTLLAICLSVVLVNEGLRIGPLTLEADSLALPVLILGLVYVPYAARPVRAQAMALRDAEFVQAAISLGASPRRVLLRHVLPQLIPTLATLAPLVMGLCLLTESALSFLSIGVQAPAASWGTLIGDGQDLIRTRPLVAVAPGLMVAATVLALNLLGDAARDALDAPGR